MKTGKRIATVIKVNEFPSKKLGLFSTIVSLQQEFDGEFGKVYANEGIGLCMTEEKPDLEQGERVFIDVVGSRTSLNPSTGQTNDIADCLLLARVPAVEAAVEEPKVAAKGKRVSVTNK